MADLDSGLTDSELVNSVQSKDVPDRIALKAYAGVFDGQRVVQADINLGYVWDSTDGSDNGGTIIGVGGGSWKAEIFAPVFPLSWFDVKYSDTIDLTEETTKVQACIEAAKDWVVGELAGYGAITILVGGWVRINKTLTRCSNVTFAGESSAQSKIIWTGGNTTNHDIATSDDAVMFDFGGSSWGGFRNIRVVGYDPDNETVYPEGEKSSNGIDHLAYYTFLDFMHTYENVHLDCGVLSGAKMLETDDLEHFTNFNATNLFAGLPSDGYLFDFEIPVFGANRMFNINGLTLGNDDSGNSKGIISCPGSIDIAIRAGRIESNYQSNIDTQCIVNFTAMAPNVSTTVSIEGITGYKTGSGAFTVVRTPEYNKVALTMIGDGLRGVRLLKSADRPDLDIINYSDKTATLLAGVETTSLVVGEKTIHLYNASNVTTGNTLLVKKNDIALTCDGDGHILHYLIDDDTIYVAGTSGYVKAAEVTGTIGQTTLPFNKDDVFTALVNMAVRVSNGGSEGSALDTKVTAIDFVAGTITLADALLSDVVDDIVYIIGGKAAKDWLYPIETLPVEVPHSNDEGASVYVKDIATMAFWGEDRWMYGTNLSCVTLDRPAYTSDARFNGCQVFDTDLGIPIWWNGTVWVDATGTTV